LDDLLSDGIDFCGKSTKTTRFAVFSGTEDDLGFAEIKWAEFSLAVDEDIDG
jgi:hypothetical protein